MEDLKKYITKLIQESLSDEMSDEFKMMKKATKDRGYKFEGKRDLSQGPQYMFSKPIGDAFAVIAFGTWKGTQVASATVVEHDPRTGKPEPRDIFSGPINYTGFMGMLDLMKREEKRAVDRYLGIGGDEPKKGKNPLMSKDYSSDISNPLAKAGIGYNLQFNEGDLLGGGLGNGNEKLLNYAKSLKSAINFQDVIQFLNDKDVDYHNWRDLDMIIYYLENNEDGIDTLGVWESLREEWEE
jgi:hypothetical protein